MPRLDIATTAVSAPMGIQVYEEEIARRAGKVLDPGWQVSRTIVRSVRSELPGTRRLPFNHLDRAPAAVRTVAGRLLYRPGSLVHRMDLSLPPAPYELVTIHDVVAWKFPDEAPPARLAPQECRRAAAVICPSAFTAQEAVDLLGVRDPRVIHNGVDERFFAAAPLDAADRAALGLTGEFVLHAGGASLRKNLRALAEAWPKVHAEHPDLVLAMSGPPSPSRHELFGDLPGVRLLGRVDDHLVPGLVAAARLVVVPSSYEGFGLPALEAMACGVPVVAANRSALPEVCGDAAILVEPDGPGVATGLLDALASPGAAAELAEAGRIRALTFSWTRSAEQHAEVWRALWAGRP